MKKLIMIIVLALTASTALADDLTLNELPSILLKLRGCTESRSFLSGSTTVCKIPKSDLWAAVGGDGELTLFRQRSYGNTTYAHGNSVGELLRDFAAKINEDRTLGQSMLDALAPFLPSQ